MPLHAVEPFIGRLDARTVVLFRGCVDIFVYWPMIEPCNTNLGTGGVALSGSAFGSVQM